MSRKGVLVFGFWALLLLLEVFGVVLNVPLVSGSGTIYIRADGSVYPPGVPISSADNVTYTFTGNINDSIVVERDNIVINGAGHTVQGTGSGTGISLSERINVTIQNMEIKAFDDGIRLYKSSNNSISGNNIANNWYGIVLRNSSNNSIIGNTFTNDGLIVWYSYQNSVENNTVNGKPLVYLEGVSNYSVGDAGQVILVRCDTIRVEGLNLSGTDVGVQLDETNNSIISGNNITNNWYGISLWYSSNNSIIGNNITNNDEGIWLLVSSNNNSIIGNSITANNWYGIFIWYSSNNSIYHNNFINNRRQAYPYESSYNTWDNGYPSGGNYWSDYEGRDLDQDGIGDTPYVIDENNTDNYPLIGMFSNFTISWEEKPHHLTTICNSTIFNFQFNALQRMISFNVSGLDYTLGFCRITIPNLLIQQLWKGNYAVLVDGKEPLTLKNWTDGTNTYLYFTYMHSEREVIIVPEFSSALIPPLLMTLTMLAVIFAKRKTPRKFKT